MNKLGSDEIDMTVFGDTRRRIVNTRTGQQRFEEFEIDPETGLPVDWIETWRSQNEGQRVKAMRQPLEEIAADGEYWEELCAKIGRWKLYGWTNRHSALILTDEDSLAYITIRGSQRDDIIAAIDGKGSRRTPVRRGKKNGKAKSRKDKS